MIKRNKNKTKLKVYFLSFIIITGITSLVFNDFGVKKLIRLKNKKNSLHINIQQLLSQQILLQEEIHKLSNDTDYIEKIARERFMMVKPGEKVFRVIEFKSAQ